MYLYSAIEILILIGRLDSFTITAFPTGVPAARPKTGS